MTQMTKYCGPELLLGAAQGIVENYASWQLNSSYF